MYQNIYFDNFRKKIHIWDDKKGYIVLPHKRYAYVKNSNGRYVSLYGDRLNKVYKWDNDQPGLHESDVNAEIRALVDIYTDSDEVSEGHRVAFIDIEVEVTEGFPSVNKAENIITSIAFYDDILDEYSCFVLDPENKLNIDKQENKIIETFKSEEELLNGFYRKYLEVSPTIISGWNIDFFDIPYLYNRTIQVLGSEFANLLSPIKEVHWSKYKNRYLIAGVSCLDYLSLYKKFTFGQEPSYRLDDIGEKEVGVKKIPYSGTLNDLYENDLKKFVEYNINDVEIIKKLDDKLDFIEICRGICHMGHCPYEDIYHSSRYLEGAILTYLKRLDIVAPNKDPKGREKMDTGVKFVGAYVQEPQKGKHDWIYDLDVTSMYPSTIMSLNISPETKVGKVKGWNAKQFIRGEKKTYTAHTKDGKLKGSTSESKLKKYLDDNKISISTNGILYRTDKRGLIPALLETWFNQRVEYRKLMKKFADKKDNEKYLYFNRRQHLQKILLNSMYGVLGLPVFRFYDLDNAAATTETGQSLIKYSKEIVNFFYNKELGTSKDYVIYIDTDSIFAPALPLIQKKYPSISIKSDVIISEKILDIAENVQDYINDSYNYFAKHFCNLDTHRFQIKQEVIAKSGLFVTKKRYGMRIINDNGVKVNKIHVKGLDTVRSNFPPALRQLLSDVLEDILADVPKDKIDDRIINFKKSMKLMNIDKIATPTGVKGLWKYIRKGEKNGSILTSFKKGAPVHVKAAIRYNDLLRHFKRDGKYMFINNGDKIRWSYMKNNELGIEVVAYKGHEDPPEIIKFIRENIDYNKIYKQSLKKKIDMFYKSLEWGDPVDKSQTIERFF